MSESVRNGTEWKYILLKIELIYSINRIIAFIFLDGIMRLREFSINPLGDQLFLDSHR